MKKSIFYIAGLMALLTFSCTDEEILKSDTFRITGGIGTQSRTTFVEDGDVTHTYWAVNDAVGLFTDTQSNLPYKALSEGSSTDFVAEGTAKLEQEEGKKVYAYYPYTNNVQDNQVRLPYTLSLSSESSVPIFLYSEANITGNELNFTFKHLYAYLKLTVTAQDFRDLFPGDGYTYEDCGIYIYSTEPISTPNAYFDVSTHEISHTSTDYYRIIYYCPDVDVESDGSYTYMIPILPQSASTPIDIKIFYCKEERDGYIYPRRLLSKNTPENGFQAGHVYCLSTTEEVIVEESQYAALEAFYQATGGDQWYNNANWLSERPLIDWYGVNNGNANYGYVKSLQLDYNNLTGNLPEEFATLMDNAGYINLDGNLLTGDIPDAVKKHENWNKLGWYIVHQDQRNGGGLNLENSNLYTDNETVTDFLEGKQSALYDLFAKNKLTQVIMASGSNEILRTFDAARVNRYLDFQSKGLGTVFFTCAEEGTDNTELQSFINKIYGDVEGVTWLYGYHRYDYYSYLYDSNGQLVHIAQYGLGEDNTSIIEDEYEFLRSYLGEPDTSHPQFSISYYTSSDYSQDGEVFTIQTATEGKGIDLVLMGEGFTDKDMASGGHYEQMMQEATEKIFELEPYKSFRKRFNVYGVKVVSPNAEFTNDAVLRINEDYSIAFDYAQKVVGENADKVMAIVIYNTESYVKRSYCKSWSDGSFVAYNMDVIDNTLIHEVCGHGIGKLADEYVEGGNEDLTLTEERKNALDKWKNYLWGCYKNVDYNGTVETVNWSHLLSDSRYDEEDLDIYEGAYLYGHGAYRPSENSMMHHNISWFNAPSREAIYKAIMYWSEGDDWEYNYEEFVSYDAINRSEGRSVSPQLTEAEKRQILSRHRPPQMMQGIWRDALKQSGHNAIIPLR